MQNMFLEDPHHHLASSRFTVTRRWTPCCTSTPLRLQLPVAPEYLCNMASGYDGNSQPVQAYNYPGSATQPGVNEQPYNPHEKQPSAPPMMNTYGAVQPATVPQYGQPASSGAGYVNMDHHGGGDYHKATRVVDCGKIIRLGFIRKVYGILSFQVRSIGSKTRLLAILTSPWGPFRLSPFMFCSSSSQ
jgi:hypothetical protein